MISKTVVNFALAAALATGALAINGTAQAGDWADAIGVSKSVTGPRQTADHSTAWASALSVENVKGSPQVAISEPYGFLGQALAQGFDGQDGGRATSKIAAR